MPLLENQRCALAFDDHNDNDAGTSPIPMATAAVRNARPKNGIPGWFGAAIATSIESQNETHDAGRKQSCASQILISVEDIST
jgi:hypothetical protein